MDANTYNFNQSMLGEVKSSPLVYVIVVNFNGREHLEYCLPSLLASDYPNYRLLVVDNASSDGSPDYVAQRFPSVELLRSSTNSGWAGGNNQGIKYACERGAKYVLLANPDIQVHPAWIASAIRIANSNRTVGMVGFNVFGAVCQAPIEAFQQACKEWSELKSEPTNIIDGLALLIQTDVLENIGLIDEDFFCYAEEEDLELRAIAAGYKLIKINVPIWHYSQGTFRKYPILASRLAMRNRLRLSLKHDNFIGVTKTILKLIHIACNPFYRGDLTNVTIRRIRPRNIFFNSILLGMSFAWNILNLHNTLKARQRDELAIQLTRQHLLKTENKENID